MFLCIHFFSLQSIGVAGVCTGIYVYVVPVIHVAQHNGMALYYCCLPGTTYDSCPCRSFVTTELVSLLDEESARTPGVLMSLRRMNGLMRRQHTHNVCALHPDPNPGAHPRA